MLVPCGGSEAGGHARLSTPRLFLRLQERAVCRLALTKSPQDMHYGRAADLGGRHEKVS